MIQFQKYPIYAVYSRHRQKTVEPLWNKYYAERQNARSNAFRSLIKFDLSGVIRHLQVSAEKDDLISGAIAWQLIEDLDPKYRTEIQRYDSTIERTLTTISHTSIGKKLLDSISTAEKVWIVPADWDDPTAKTEPKTETEGGGIRIYFNPEAFRRIFISPRLSADEVADTLFHELVHAMRFSQKRYLNKGLLNSNFISTEEFLATQMENVYHASRRTSDIYGTYHGGYKNKREMYKYLAEDSECVPLLKYFLKTEPLAQYAATLHQPEYNPFRDYKQIEAHALNFYGIDKFSDFN